MTAMDVHYSSAAAERETPRDLFDRLHAEFAFTLDVAATAENAKCPECYTAAVDGLKQIWSGVCWMNPPYGRQIGKWVRKAYEESQTGATVVCLLPARTDTSWFHDYCLRGEIRWIRGRLYFIGPAKTDQPRAPFPSMIVIFRGPA